MTDDGDEFKHYVHSEGNHGNEATETEAIRMSSHKCNATQTNHNKHI